MDNPGSYDDRPTSKNKRTKFVKRDFQERGKLSSNFGFLFNGSDNCCLVSLHNLHFFSFHTIYSMNGIAFTVGVGGPVGSGKTVRVKKKLLDVYA